MARDIGEGFILLSPVSLRKFEPSDFAQLLAEVEKLARETRGENPAGDDTQEIQKKNRKLQRLSQAQMVIQAFRTKHRR